MEAQIKKGILEMCVLYMICDREMYGYDVMKSMKKYFPEVNESTFYSILRRLHADGNAQVKISPESNGPNRKYYKITAAGRDILSDSIRCFQRICSAVEEMGIHGQKEVVVI